MKQVLFTLLLFFVSYVSEAQETKLYTIYFATNSSDVKSSDVEALKGFLSLPDSLKPLSMLLTGSCDDVGSSEANTLLAAKRIAAVRKLIVGRFRDTLSIKEVNRGRIPMVDNSVELEAYRAGNRKVVLALSVMKKELQPIPSELKNARLQVGERIAMNNILFEGGSSEFLPESNGSLLDLYELMKSNPELKVCIRGHVCCGPPDRDGIDLSTGKYGLSVFRAQAVYSYLLNKGIAQDRLSYKGLGASEPTGKGDRFDRRVEIEITATGK